MNISLLKTKDAPEQAQTSHPMPIWKGQMEMKENILQGWPV